MPPTKKKTTRSASLGAANGPTQTSSTAATPLSSKRRSRGQHPGKQEFPGNDGSSHDNDSTRAGANGSQWPVRDEERRAIAMKYKQAILAKASQQRELLRGNLRQYKQEYESDVISTKDAPIPTLAGGMQPTEPTVAKTNTAPTVQRARESQPQPIPPLPFDVTVNSAAAAAALQRSVNRTTPTAHDLLLAQAASGAFSTPALLNSLVGMPSVSQFAQIAGRPQSANFALYQDAMKTISNFALSSLLGHTSVASALDMRKLAQSSSVLNHANNLNSASAALPHLATPAAATKEPVSETKHVTSTPDSTPQAIVPPQATFTASPVDQKAIVAPPPNLLLPQQQADRADISTTSTGAVTMSTAGPEPNSVATARDSPAIGERAESPDRADELADDSTEMFGSGCLNSNHPENIHDEESMLPSNANVVHCVSTDDKEPIAPPFTTPLPQSATPPAGVMNKPNLSKQPAKPMPRPQARDREESIPIIQRKQEVTTAKLEALERRFVYGKRGTPFNLPRLKSQWDCLLDEMQWMAIDFKQERRWKITQSKHLAGCFATSALSNQKHSEQLEDTQSAAKLVAVRVAQLVEHSWAGAVNKFAVTEAEPIIIAPVVQLEVPMVEEPPGEVPMVVDPPIRQESIEPAIPARIESQLPLINELSERAANIINTTSTATSQHPYLYSYQTAAVRLIQELHKQSLGVILHDERPSGRTTACAHLCEEVLSNSNDLNSTSARVLVFTARKSLTRWQYTLARISPSSRISIIDRAFCRSSNEAIPTPAWLEQLGNVALCPIEDFDELLQHEGFLSLSWHLAICDIRGASQLTSNRVVSDRLFSAQQFQHCSSRVTLVQTSSFASLPVDYLAGLLSFSLPNAFSSTDEVFASLAGVDITNSDATHAQLVTTLSSFAISLLQLSVHHKMVWTELDPPVLDRVQMQSLQQRRYREVLAILASYGALSTESIDIFANSLVLVRRTAFHAELVRTQSRRLVREVSTSLPSSSQPTTQSPNSKTNGQQPPATQTVGQNAFSENESIQSEGPPAETAVPNGHGAPQRPLGTQSNGKPGRPRSKPNMVMRFSNGNAINIGRGPFITDTPYAEMSATEIASKSCKLVRLLDILAEQKSKKVLIVVESIDEHTILHNFLRSSQISHRFAGGKHNLADAGLAWLCAQADFGWFNDTDGPVVLTCTSSMLSTVNGVIPSSAECVVVLSEDWSMASTLYRDLFAVSQNRPNIVRVVMANTLEDVLSSNGYNWSALKGYTVQSLLGVDTEESLELLQKTLSHALLTLPLFTDIPSLAESNPSADLTSEVVSAATIPLQWSEKLKSEMQRAEEHFVMKGVWSLPVETGTGVNTTEELSVKQHSISADVMASFFLQGGVNDKLALAIAAFRAPDLFGGSPNAHTIHTRTSLDPIELDRYQQIGFGLSPSEAVVKQTYAPMVESSQPSFEDWLAALRRIGMPVEPVLQTHPLQRKHSDDDIQSAPSWMIHIPADDNEFSIKYLVRSSARTGRRQRSLNRVERFKRPGDSHAVGDLKRHRHDSARTDRRLSLDPNTNFAHRRPSALRETDISLEDWSAVEDATLEKLFEMYGPSFRLVAQALNSIYFELGRYRSARQCMDRYTLLNQPSEGEASMLTADRAVDQDIRWVSRDTRWPVEYLVTRQMNMAQAAKERPPKLAVPGSESANLATEVHSSHADATIQTILGLTPIQIATSTRQSEQQQPQQPQQTQQTQQQQQQPPVGSNLMSQQRAGSLGVPAGPTSRPPSGIQQSVPRQSNQPQSAPAQPDSQSPRGAQAPRPQGSQLAGSQQSVARVPPPKQIPRNTSASGLANQTTIFPPHNSLPFQYASASPASSGSAGLAGVDASYRKPETAFMLPGLGQVPTVSSFNPGGVRGVSAPVGLGGLMMGSSKQLPGNILLNPEQMVQNDHLLAVLGGNPGLEAQVRQILARTDLAEPRKVELIANLIKPPATNSGT